MNAQNFPYLMYIFVNCSMNLLMLVRLHDFMLNTRGDCLMNGCVVMAGVRSELVNCSLDFIHSEVCVLVVCIKTSDSWES